MTAPIGYPWPLSNSAHDRTCAHVTTRFAYCDCALSSGRARTLIQLAAIAEQERAERDRHAAIVRRAEDAYEDETSEAVATVIHAILHGDGETADDLCGICSHPYANHNACDCGHCPGYPHDHGCER